MIEIVSTAFGIPGAVLLIPILVMLALLAFSSPEDQTFGIRQRSPGCAGTALRMLTAAMIIYVVILIARLTGVL